MMICAAVFFFLKRVSSLKVFFFIMSSYSYCFFFNYSGESWGGSGALDYFLRVLVLPKMAFSYYYYSSYWKSLPSVATEAPKRALLLYKMSL